MNVGVSDAFLRGNFPGNLSKAAKRSAIVFLGVGPDRAVLIERVAVDRPRRTDNDEAHAAALQPLHNLRRGASIAPSRVAGRAGPYPPSFIP